ncbi:hypothetical protein IscW_ISCW001652 [Ixodes scapularis]|uniref:Cuticle protein n=1 Tax=Ixodes scapularis TaxID=6945 RepID=B7P4Q3_IXOSC|nr:hypothetical protein IscW_ISCW001652 [Ixodes scapularis]|eukprot:XP_002406348.1 hypothetical protein IscW_ISCW001652 [Ixodes scapularis]
MAGFNRIQLLLLHSLALWCAVNAGGLHPHTEGYSHQIHHPDGSTHHSTFIKHNTDVVPRDHDSSVYDHSSGHVVSVHSTGPHGVGAYGGGYAVQVAAAPVGVSVVQPAAAAVYSQRFAVHAAPAAAAVVHAAPAAVVHAGGEVHHKLVGPDGSILGRLKK